MLTLLCC